MGAHSIFAPSSMYRAITCPASVRLSMNLENKESPAAAEGTVAHHVAEYCMKNRIPPSELRGKWFFYMGEGVVSDDICDSLDCLYDFEVDDEMVQYLSGYIAHCRRRKGKKYVEIRVDISPWTPIPDQKGTSDHIAIWFEGGTLYVDDLKYGKGVKVAPQENWQAISYALGTVNWLLREFPDDFQRIKHVVIGIYQPRIDNIDEWVTDIPTIMKRGEYMKQRLKLAWSDDAPFGPDPKACEFCRVVKCRARREALAAQMPMEEGEGELKAADVETIFLSDDEAAQFLLLRPWYEKTFNAIHDHLFKAITDRVPNAYLRLGEGNQKRFWKNKSAVILFLEDLEVKNIFTEPKLESPAKIEKKLRGQLKKDLQQFIGSAPGAPRLVPMNSKHRDYGSQALGHMPNEEADEFGL